MLMQGAFLQHNRGCVLWCRPSSLANGHALDALGVKAAEVRLQVTYKLARLSPSGFDCCMAICVSGRVCQW